MPNLWNATKCNGVQMPYSRNVTGSRGKINEMLRNYLQAELDT